MYTNDLTILYIFTPGQPSYNTVPSQLTGENKALAEEWVRGISVRRDFQMYQESIRGPFSSKEPFCHSPMILAPHEVIQGPFQSLIRGAIHLGKITFNIFVWSLLHSSSSAFIMPTLHCHFSWSDDWSLMDSADVKGHLVENVSYYIFNNKIVIWCRWVHIGNYNLVWAFHPDIPIGPCDISRLNTGS